MQQLTVFTPTYNRAYRLGRCYESLTRQSNKNFIWLIIDDGSTDETYELVSGWIREEKTFEIRYLYQENKGMHSAHNLAYENISTPLNVCIDSDDYMPDRAVEKILKFWEEAEKDESVAGFLGLDAFEDGEIVGTCFPPELERATSYDYYYGHKIKGDKKYIIRTDLAKLYPYPIFEGEKYVNLATKYSLLDLDYKFLNLNEVLCIIEYLQDGSSKNMFRQYIHNPKGFAYSRKLSMSLPHCGLRFKFRQAVHYVSSSIISRDSRFYKDCPSKLLLLAAALPGLLWFLYIKYRYRKDY
ncbi:MAG: glycosyltransferase family 2 protein [Clostridiales bacterium]|nr:glycosyltransferase family 2 protein [Clostridiales bacterium]